MVTDEVNQTFPRLFKAQLTVREEFKFCIEFDKCSGAALRPICNKVIPLGLVGAVTNNTFKVQHLYS